MSKKFFMSIFIAAIVFSTPQIAFVQEQASAERPNPGNYQYHLFANTSGPSPEFILKLDNNFEILSACIGGKTIEQLREQKIFLTQSQLQLLLYWRLLKQDNNVLETTFPIISAERTNKLRRLVNTGTSIINEYLKDNVTALDTALKNKGFNNSTYSVLFSYVLSDLIWKKFAEKNIVLKGPVSIERPYWNGVFWAVTPPRELPTRMASVESDFLSLKIHWKPEITEMINRLFENYDQIGAMMKQLETSGIVEDAQVKSIFVEFGLLNADGSPAIPFILEEDENDEVYKACNDLAQKLADRFIQINDFSHLVKETELINEFIAFAVTFQEFLYEFQQNIDDSGIIAKPRALRRTADLTLADVKDLLSFVKRKSE